MKAEFITLDYLDILISTLLVLVAAGVSVALKLRLEKSLLLAASRTVVQLLLVGYVLKWVFRLNSAAVLALVALVMVGVATREAVRRQKRVFRGIYLRSFVTLVTVALLVTFTVTKIIIGVEPWWRPQYMIPLMGMILGNVLTGISLVMDTLLDAFAERSDEIEMELSLGATKWEAARDAMAESVRRGMIPIINSMTVVGLVTLPGMMTGQILAGADPLEAVKYQIVVMFMIAAAIALGCMGISVFVFRRVFNERHQLRLDRIRKVRS